MLHSYSSAAILEEKIKTAEIGCQRVITTKFNSNQMRPGLKCKCYHDKPKTCTAACEVKKKSRADIRSPRIIRVPYFWVRGCRTLSSISFLHSSLYEARYRSKQKFKPDGIFRPQTTLVSRVIGRLRAGARFSQV